MTKQIQDDLKKIALFSDLPDEIIAQLAHEVKESNFSAGDVLFNQGDEGDALYFIRSGEVEIYEVDDEKTFEVLEEGDYFGEMALLEGKPRSASARTRTESSLLRLDRAPFMALLEKNPTLALKMTSAISTRLRTSMASTQPKSTGPKTVPRKENTSKVFISYSRRDKPFVQKLHSHITTHGIETWVDWENIPLTADWWNEIRMGIENADAFAFIISPDSLTSEVCGREVQTAVDSHKRLIPILYRDPEKGNPMHEKVSAHNWIYMRDDTELAANVPQMLEVINTDLGYVRTHTRLLERALEWERAHKNASFVLQGDELQNAERWLVSAADKEPAPAPLHIEFIQAGRRAATRRQRTIMTASLVGLGIAVVLAIVSFVFFLQARDSQAEAVVQRDNALAAEAFANQQASLAATAQAEAETSRDNAEVARVAAVTAQAEAENQASIAASERAIAVTAQAEAETQKALAEDKALLAKAGDLAASGLTLLESNPPLAVLLALESERLSPNNKTAQDVLSLLPIYFPPLKDAFIDPSQSVSNLSWSPSGQLVSSSGSSIILWNLETHEPEQILEGHITPVTAMAWSPDGRLTTGADDGSVLIWNLETGEAETVEPVVPAEEVTYISGISWSPRGYLTYAYGDAEGTMVVQDVTGAVDPTILKNGRPVNAIAWSPPPSPALAAGLDNGIVAIWTVNIAEGTGRISTNYDDHEAGIISLAYAPDGSLASGSRDSTVAVRGPFGSRKAILSGHTDYVNVVAWSDDNRLASASWDKTVILWDLVQKAPERIFRGHSSSVTALDWGPEGRLTSGADFIYVWDTTSDSALTTYPGHLDWTYFVRWTPQGQLVSAGGDNKIIFWEEDTPQIAESIPMDYISELEVSSNDRILTGGTLLDRQTGKEYLLQGYEQVFSPDGNFVAGLTYNFINEFAIWPLAPLVDTGEAVSNTFTLEGDVGIQIVTCSPDGNTIATGQTDGTIALWDFNPTDGTAALHATLPGHEGGLNVLAWSPDGRLASAGNDSIIIWDVAALEQAKVLTNINEQIIGELSWSPNGELASISNDNNIVVWDVDEGKVKALLGAPYRAPITSIAWSPDGTKLAFGGQSYNVYVYNTLYVQPPCTWLTRNMTYAEWSTYLPGELYQPTCPERPVGTAYLDEGSQLAASGEIAAAVGRYQQAEEQGLIIDAWKWNDLCWFGALYNQAEISSFACDRAVELLPDDGDIRDSRGVSHALLGDFAGAIEDFQAFIAYAQENGYGEDVIAQRQAWIEALQAGTNPFDEETLAMLRGE